MGAGRRGGRRAGRRRRPRARCHVAADDGAARSVGEHAAHHAGRVRRRASVVPTRVLVQPFDAAIPDGFPAPRRVSRGASPATRNCCCWRSPTSAGCSTRPAGSFFVEDLTRAAGRTGVGALPGHRSARSASSRRSSSILSPRRSPRWPSVAPTTSRTGAPGLTGVNEYADLAEPHCRRIASASSVRRYAAGFEALRDRSDGYLEKNRVATAGVAAATGTARRAQHPCDVRGQPAGAPAASGR